jgi:uncharacterized protein YihD (DUF1040 family)
MFYKVKRLEKIIKLLVQHLQNPNNDNLIQILELLKENELVTDKEGNSLPLTEEQILTQQLLDDLQPQPQPEQQPELDDLQQSTKIL